MRPGKLGFRRKGFLETQLPLLRVFTELPRA
jgi:hypothetical protein